MISVGSAVLEQFTAECPYALLCATPPTQNCPFSWGIWTPSNKWFLGLTRPQNLNGISIGSIVLQDSLLWQTDRPTDRQTDHATRSVTIGRI